MEINVAIAIVGMMVAIVGILTAVIVQNVGKEDKKLRMEVLEILDPSQMRIAFPKTETAIKDRQKLMGSMLKIGEKMEAIGKEKNTKKIINPIEVVVNGSIGSTEWKD